MTEEVKTYDLQVMCDCGGQHLEEGLPFSLSQFDLMAIPKTYQEPVCGDYVDTENYAKAERELDAMRKELVLAQNLGKVQGKKVTDLTRQLEAVRDEFDFGMEDEIKTADDLDGVEHGDLSRMIIRIRNAVG